MLLLDICNNSFSAMGLSLLLSLHVTICLYSCTFPPAISFMKQHKKANAVTFSIHSNYFLGSISLWRVKSGQQHDQNKPTETHPITKLRNTYVCTYFILWFCHVCFLPLKILLPRHVVVASTYRLPSYLRPLYRTWWWNYQSIYFLSLTTALDQWLPARQKRKAATTYND